jgi:hypothetical protein
MDSRYFPPQQQVALHPAEVRRMVDSVAQQAAQSNKSLLVEMEALRQDLETLRTTEAVRVPRFIEDIPGPRQPYYYVLQIPFHLGDTAQNQSSVTIATDGPFICTAMSAYYKMTSGQVGTIGAWMPVTTLPFNIYNAAGPPAGAVEFSFRILTGGSGRQWQSDWLPAPMIHGWADSPHYTGVKGWVDRTNTLTVQARPEFAVPSNGDVWFIFEGYQILTPVDLAKILGWHT